MAMKNKDIDIDISNLPSPAYLVDERLLTKNLKTLNYVQEKSGAKILLAQKASPCTLCTHWSANTCMA